MATKEDPVVKFGRRIPLILKILTFIALAFLCFAIFIFPTMYSLSVVSPDRWGTPKVSINDSLEALKIDCEMLDGTFTKVNEQNYKCVSDIALIQVTVNELGQMKMRVFKNGN